MKLAIDFDNVLAHTTHLWVEICNHRDNGARNISVRDVEKWDFWKDLGLDNKEAFDIFDITWESWEKIPPIESEIQQKTKMLSNLFEGKIDVVTSVKEGHKVAVHSWLAKHGIYYRDVVFSEKKHKLDYDIYIDDSPYNAIDIYKNKKLCLLYNQPWNREIPNKSGSIVGIRRVYNLYHAIDIIRDIIGRNGTQGRFDKNRSYESSSCIMEKN